MPVSLLFGVNENGFVVLSKNNYDYSKNTLVMELLREYKKVQFENKFNSRIDWLPEGITDVHLGTEFNQPIDNLPHTIKRITIMPYNDIEYTKFNQPMDNLPTGLEELSIVLNKSFNKPLDNLPTGLKKICLHLHNFLYPINTLPNSIEEINIKQFDHIETYQLPSNLRVFKVLIKKSDLETNPDLANIKALQEKYTNVKFIYQE
jgi:hypothetical protein